jgi:hypothetical protein
MRLRTDFWVSAYLRRCDVEGVVAVLRRRGAPEAGAIYVKLDCLDGRAAVFGPAPQIEAGGTDRIFVRVHKEEWIDPADAELRLGREVSFDADLWIVEVEDRSGDARIDLVTL